MNIVPAITLHRTLNTAGLSARVCGSCTAPAAKQTPVFTGTFKPVAVLKSAPMNTARPKTELLSPAGTIKNMRYAFAYGADAVYAGQPRYSLRVRNNDFKDKNLEIGINEAHRLGKKFFLTSNLMPHNSKVQSLHRRPRTGDRAWARMR